ncbi:MAG: metallophosphoesterase [Gemmataceae bacterium]
MKFEPPMIAILSDIHANLEALEAVLDDARRHGAEKIYCLGDIVGYGPDPLACIDLAMTFDVNLVGNHDWAVMFDPEGFGVTAEKAIFYTRSQLEKADEFNGAQRERRWRFLLDLPRKHCDGLFLYVHGSARNQLNEYVCPEDIHNKKKMEALFGLIDLYCFQGHTHVPCIITADLQCKTPGEVDGLYRLEGRKTICNVGSVGQPRDGDWRACYVLLHGDIVRFRRVEYDIDKTVKKIFAIEELENFCATRLRKGS